MTDLLVGLLLALLVAVALATTLARDVVLTTVLFGAYSLGLAVLWLVFTAPDVALTEAAVGAGVTSSLFVVAIRETVEPLEEGAFGLRLRPRSLLAAGVIVLALGVTVPALPAVGDPNAPAFGGAAAFYLDATPTFGIRNAVTAVLVVFRGFDTFGEVVVVFAAAVAVAVVVGREEL